MTTATATDNASMVGKLYAAFGRGDIAFIADHIDDHCQWIASGKGVLPTGGVYHGKEALNFFKKLGELETFTSFNPVAIHNLPHDEVIALGNMTGTSKITGKSVSSDWAMHWKFNHKGKVIFFQEYFDTAAAYLSHQP